MNTKIAALILGAMAAIGSGSPMAVPNAKSTIVARGSAENSTAPGKFHTEVANPTPNAITHLFVCIDKNFGGRCQNLETTTNVCFNLGNGFSDSISSLGPDQGTTCTIYDNQGCSGTSVGGIVSPGINDLSDFGFNDRASSYRCV
ncbi:MAG: hypothetical protein Q9213_001531 [Squamulea squamosa]